MKLRRRRSRWTTTLWKPLRHNRFAMVGLALIAFFGLLALSYPLLRATLLSGEMYDPLFGHDLEILHPSSPSVRHPLGTDSLGRDVLSMTLAATVPTWLLAVAAALTTAVVGMAVGAIGAYRRGWTDGLLSHLSYAFLLLPAPIFMLVIGTGGFGRDLGPIRFGLIYGLIVGLGGAAIVLRSHGLQVMARPFIDAARVAGAGGPRLVVRHLLPHMVALAVVFMMLAVVGAVVADGFASWLGQTGTRLSWGVMVYYGTTFPDPLTGQPPWNALIPPAVCLSLFAAAFYMVSVGLRQVVDPREQSARTADQAPTAL